MILRLRERGDTIIEVLVAIAIVAAVLGSVFVTMNRGTYNARQSQEHEEALKYAESQVELLGTYLADHNQSAIALGSKFCFNRSTFALRQMSALVNEADYGNFVADCVIDGTGFDYHMSIWHKQQDTYYAYVTWDGPTGAKEQVSLVYRMAKVTDLGTPPYVAIHKPLLWGGAV